MPFFFSSFWARISMTFLTLSLSSAAFSNSFSFCKAIDRCSWAQSNSSSISWMRLFRETTWASVVSLSFLSWSSSSCKLPPPPVPACSRSSFAPPPTSYSRPSCGAAAGRLQSERPAALWTPCCTPEHQASLWRPCSTGPA